MIVLVPDAPISLTDDTTVTSRSVIRFTWAPAASDGGSTILSYTVTYDESVGNLGTVLKTGITSLSYTSDITILAGRTY